MGDLHHPQARRAARFGQGAGRSERDQSGNREVWDRGSRAAKETCRSARREISARGAERPRRIIAARPAAPKPAHQNASLPSNDPDGSDERALGLPRKLRLNPGAAPSACCAGFPGPRAGSARQFLSESGAMPALRSRSRAITGEADGGRTRLAPPHRTHRTPKITQIRGWRDL